MIERRRTATAATAQTTAKMVTGDRRTDRRIHRRATLSALSRRTETAKCQIRTDRTSKRWRPGIRS